MNLPPRLELRAIAIPSTSPESSSLHQRCFGRRRGEPAGRAIVVSARRVHVARALAGRVAGRTAKPVRAARHALFPRAPVSDYTIMFAADMSPP